MIVEYVIEHTVHILFVLICTVASNAVSLPLSTL